MHVITEHVLIVISIISRVPAVFSDWINVVIVLCSCLLMITHNIELCHSGGLEVADENNVFVLTKTSFSKLRTSCHCFRPYLAAFECRLALKSDDGGLVASSRAG